MKELLSKQTSARILPFDLNDPDVFAFDLTSRNQDLASIDLSSTEDFTRYIFSEMEKRNTPVALGRYDEDRVIYERSEIFGGDRSIHLGIDLWARAGTPVFAPLGATVHSTRNNSSFGDYGGTIVLQHEIEGKRFFTLYGHLAPRSVMELEIGMRIARAQKIAVLGEEHENVGYPPHLHFQIITDMIGKEGDFPGVASRAQRKRFLEICPDPNLLLKIDCL